MTLGHDTSAALPTVDVLLTTFNGARFLNAQLQSVLSQQDVAVRIWVFDDCSTDTTRDELRAIMAQDPRVSVTVRDTPSGGAFESFRAAVMGFEPTRQYIAFCDQDDIWLPQKLSLQVEALRAHDAVGCSSSVEAFSDDGLTESRVVDNVGRQSALDYFFEGAGQGCTYLFTPEAFHLLRLAFTQVGDEVIHHDWLMYAVCRFYGKTWVILNEPLVKYRQHASNAFGARGSWLGRIRRLSMLMDSSFRERRLRLASVLKRLPDPVHPVPDVLANPRVNLMRRFLFGLPRLRQFRRFGMHAAVVGLFFVLGKA